MKLELSRLHFPVTALGPGNRVGIWFQGCSIRCDGCISADTWGRGIGGTTVEHVMSAIEPWLADAEGVTISGGEPFDQARALHALALGIRARTSIDILVYSGYPIERIASHVSRMDGLIDAIISDPYDARVGQTLALRGSDNQRLHCLTALGNQRFSQFCHASRSPNVTMDVMFDEDGSVWMAGIPRRGDLRRLVDILTRCGHRTVTSQAIQTGGNDE